MEEKNSQEKYDRCLLELDVCREERNLAEKEMQQYENLLHETKSELTEQMYYGKTKSGASPSSGDHAGNLKGNRKL